MMLRRSFGSCPCAIKNGAWQILHDQQDEIYLRTIKGKTGYRIKTFELISSAPGISTSESTIKIYKKKSFIS